MKKKTIYIIVGVAVVLIVLLIVGKKAGWFGKSGNFKEVEVTEVQRYDVIEKVSATGKIQPEVEVKLSSEVSGEIIELPVVEGQQVEKGDLLVRVNPEIYQSNLERVRAGLQNVRSSLSQAEASLKEAESNYQRNQTLFEKGIISKAEWDRIVSAYEGAQANRQAAFYSVRSAEASVNEAVENLGRTNIYAPMSGTISSLDAELGERVVGTQQMAGTEILRVADLSDMEVEVDVNENDIVKVSIGDSTIVEVDAYLKQEFKGVVTEISNSANATATADQVTNFKVKVKIVKESYDHLLEGKPENFSPFRPGMTATVDIITNRRDDVIAVPISAVVVKADTSAGSRKPADANAALDELFETVYVKEGDEAKVRVVETGIQDDARIEIKEGLETGEMVITGPYNTVTKILKPGDKVEVKGEVKGEKE
ncbi:efflux RND transporter periplasmic adaptor subunit [Salinimicrobium tongyeongense]|jgi:HlyD family secretion protein|uniref:Efflux RND transporter periplasmic adaptor subunit n=1 Tax=Salinimicrobium tongyeongense TaxID=2809707 RepID=A0ABY6NTM8_9FLAO|nr:efflux RND transporter periplasmic adaptor subunit [Salinimicrobium tongyeongense]UZH56272.1 efflux RND transporter periplasmic adaptor subunit [Salinimicrobium tongyeongense]